MAAAAQLSDIFRGSLKQQMLFLSKVPFNQICSCLEMCATPSVPVAGICTQTCRGKLRKCCLWQQNRLGVLLFLQSNSCAFEWRPAKMTVECFSAVLLNQKMFVLHWSLWDLVGMGLRPKSFALGKKLVYSCASATYLHSLTNNQLLRWCRSTDHGFNFGWFLSKSTSKPD